MTCRSEHWTRENHAPALRLQYRLQSISIDWVNNRVREKNRRILERRRAIVERNQGLRAVKTMMKRKVRTWKREIHGLNMKLINMDRKYREDPTSVKAEDWDKMVTGQETKLQVIFANKYPREKWPAGIPYLNMIALAQHVAAKKAARARKKAALKKTALKKPQITAALPIHSKPVEVSPWDDPAIMRAQIIRLEHETAQSEKQLVLLKKSRANPMSVSFEQWREAIEGTDAVRKDMTIACYVELARRRAMGEECDGWVYGRYYGP